MSLKEIAIGMFLVAAFFGPFLAIYLRDRRQLRLWERAARELGIELVSDKTMRGDIDGIEVRIAIERRGSGSSKPAYTTWIAYLSRPLPAGLSIQPSGMAMKLLGGKDVQLGLPDLDERLIVRAQNAAETREWASQEHVKAALTELAGLDAKFVLRDARLRIEESGIVTKLETLTLHALQASSLGRELSG